MQPNLNPTVVVDSHHGFINIEVAYLLEQLVKATKTVVVEVQYIRVRHISEVVQPDVDLLGEHANQVMASTKFFLRAI